MLDISSADFENPSLVRFLQDHLDDISPTAPSESQHALDLATLRHPNIRMWVAREDDLVVGTVALMRLSEDHEELKSMRTLPARRGTGIGSKLLGHALQDARPGCSQCRWRREVWSSLLRHGRSTARLAFASVRRSGVIGKTRTVCS